MARLLLLALLLLCTRTAVAADSTDPTIGADPQKYADLFNPDFLGLDSEGKPLYPMRNTFASPASNISHEVMVNNWFNLLVYLPFLVAPQVLLVIVIFRFKDRGDGRKPATFLTNHKLEAVWTIIPILALLVVSVPVAKVLYHMELVPAEVDTNDPTKAELIIVTGKQYAWGYKYEHEGITIDGLNPISQAQDPVVLVKGRVASLSITSEDVNHSWWVPAFGVKKSAIRGRYTNTWFTPTEEGVFKGSCAELCGEGHGKMFINSVVVTPQQFEIWKVVQRAKADAGDVWDLLQPASDTQPASDAQLQAAVEKYLKADPSPARRFALRYWVDANYLALHRSWMYPTFADDLRAHEAERKARIDTLVAMVGTPAPAVARQ